MNKHTTIWIERSDFEDRTVKKAVGLITFAIILLIAQIWTLDTGVQNRSTVATSTPAGSFQPFPPP